MNDSPRQPIWNKLKEQFLATSAQHLRPPAAPAPRRCLCGAIPQPDGRVPCGH